MICVFTIEGLRWNVKASGDMPEMSLVDLPIIKIHYNDPDVEPRYEGHEVHFKARDLEVTVHVFSQQSDDRGYIAEKARNKLRKIQKEIQHAFVDHC